MSTNHAGSPRPRRRDCLTNSLRYFWSKDCTSCRIPRDDLTGISCQLGKRRPFFLIRTLSSKAYATSSWRAAKNPSSSSLSGSSVRTHGASTRPLSTRRVHRQSDLQKPTPEQESTGLFGRPTDLRQRLGGTAAWRAVEINPDLTEQRRAGPAEWKALGRGVQSCRGLLLTQELWGAL